MNMLCVRFWICKEAGEQGEWLLNDNDDIKSEGIIQHNERLNSDLLSTESVRLKFTRTSQIEINSFIIATFSH